MRIFLCALGVDGVPRVDMEGGDGWSEWRFGARWCWGFRRLIGVPAGGVVFALDGVLLGAADAAFLRTATVVAVVCGFIPVVWLAWLLGWGLVGVWCGLVAFIGLRLIAVVWRFRGERWTAVKLPAQ